MSREPALRFAVRGLPAPQGSKEFKGISRTTGRAILVEASKAVRPWRQDVVIAAVDAMERHGSWRPLPGPVHLVVEFFLPRPKSQPKTRRTAPTSAPDLDKLVRSTGDALTTAGAYTDDAVVTDITVRKRYSVHDDALGHAWELPGPGAVISLFQLDEADTWADAPLDLLVGRCLPGLAVPAELSQLVTFAADVVALDAYGMVLAVTADMSETAAVAVVKKAIALVVKRQGMTPDRLMAQVPAVLVISSGVAALASVPGAPLSRLQSLVLEVAELAQDERLGITVVVSETSSGESVHTVAASTSSVVAPT